MQELGGNDWWFDRFLAQHIAVAYYFMTVFMYMVSPRMACKYRSCKLTAAYTLFLASCFAPVQFTFETVITYEVNRKLAWLSYFVKLRKALKKIPRLASVLAYINIKWLVTSGHLYASAML